MYAGNFGVRLISSILVGLHVVLLFDSRLMQNKVDGRVNLTMELPRLLRYNSSCVTSYTYCIL